MTASQPLPLAELSPAELATIERFGIYEAEEKVEKVARAIFDAEVAEAGYIDGAVEAWINADEDQDYYRRLAAAAIAVMPVRPAEEAMRRVEALCDVADDQPDGYECRFIATDVIRAAIAAPQTEEER